MFKNTCASTTPCSPKIETAGRPSACNAAFIGPARPNTASIPSTATTTGSRNGAPIRRIIALRPQNRRRAKARATGMASATETAADHAACHRVKRSAAQSAGASAQVRA